jgi:hypothetical protein
MSEGFTCFKYFNLLPAGLNIDHFGECGQHKERFASDAITTQTFSACYDQAI